MSRYSPSGGVPVFSIGGRMVHQRERLLNMSDEERRWRAQYLKDQILSPDEPRFSRELYNATTNIFRKVGKIPMDLVAKALTPIIPKNQYNHCRALMGKVAAAIWVVYIFGYQLKYRPQDWTRIGGWFEANGREAILPGDPNYPNYPKLKNQEYYDQGFSKSVFWNK